MKRVLVLLLCVSAFVSCKNDTKSTSETTSLEQNEEFKVLKGEFVFFDNAAVLQTTNEVYGVIQNDKMHELDNKAKAYKKENTDMVHVEIKGIIKPKPEGTEGWPFIIEIIEIINVSQPLVQDDQEIKLNDINN
ncbi:hypothetical protein [Formosa sp. PL04]|uniref:hypothetical protein n=1 Tax=Formosa sp. PL04 TaxID=3081755 RepID=UPI00298231E0|nr:hypothetical protein [Formosa sp. PL04]MDW5289950.1 hypothetical protein [Formosa sp. PL04]